MVNNSCGTILLFKQHSPHAFTDHSLLNHTTMETEKQSLEFNPSKIRLCILLVPSFMIPHDIIQFLSPFLSDVKNITTLRHLDAHDQYIVLIEVTSVEVAAEFIKEYHGISLCSLQPTTCLVYSVQDVDYGICGMEEGNLSNEEKTTRGESSNTSGGYQEEEEDICVLCLAPMESDHPSSFTTCCGHTFHISCTKQLENAQCPVCR